MNFFNNMPAPRNLSEFDMQDDLEKYISEFRFRRQVSEYGISFNEDNPDVRVFREVHIPEVKRRSDFVVSLGPRKVVNIECKLIYSQELVNQAMDHLKWAPYSYICIPVWEYVPSFRIREVANSQLGLIYWTPERKFIEAIPADYNKEYDKVLRKTVIDRINKRISTEKEVKSQKVLFQ